MVYASESMRVRIAPSRSPKAGKGTYKVNKAQEDEPLTAEKIQEILNSSASNLKPKPIFFSEASRTFNRAVGATLDNKKTDFGILSDADLYSKFFKEFDEQEFVAYMNFFVSELKAMIKAGIDKDGIIGALIGNIKFYMNKLRDGTECNTEPIERKAYLQGLLDEVEKRVTKQLCDRLENI